MIIYAVYASNFESSWVKKAFMSKEKAEAYANGLNESYGILANIQREFERRSDEIWELVYDRNGFNGEPLFEELDDWYENERKSLSVHEDCDLMEEYVHIVELEVEE